MANKVFGIGLSRTGTSTLGVSLFKLGFHHKSYDNYLSGELMQGKTRKLFLLADAYDSFEDLPWCVLYRELDAAYPGSKFILTTRLDPQRWVRSLCLHARGLTDCPCNEFVYGYSDPTGHEEEMLQIYDRHNASVREYFADRPHDFIEVCWERGDDWNALCSFLGVAAPDEPFPHINRGPVQRPVWHWKSIAKRLLSLDTSLR